MNRPRVNPFLSPSSLPRNPQYAAASSTSTGAANERLGFVEKLYDMVGLMRGGPYTAYVRGLFTALVPTATLYLAFPGLFYDNTTGDFRVYSLSIPLLLFVFGAFFV